MQLFCLVNSFWLCFLGIFYNLKETPIAARFELERLSLLERVVLLLVRIDALDLKDILKLADRQLQNIRGAEKLLRRFLFYLRLGGEVERFNRAALGLAVFGCVCEIVEAGEVKLGVRDLIVVP